jgi:hypothetical protein
MFDRSFGPDAVASGPPAARHFSVPETKIVPGAIRHARRHNKNREADPQFKRGNGRPERSSLP